VVIFFPRPVSAGILDRIPQPILGDLDILRLDLRRVAAGQDREEARCHAPGRRRLSIWRTQLAGEGDLSQPQTSTERET
jgi:hypothetical protein